MASDSLLNVIQGLVKREDRLAKEQDKKAKEKLKLEKEKEQEKDDEDEDPVGEPAANQPPADEPPPEAEPAPGEPEAEPEAPPQDAAPEPEAEPEPEDDGEGDSKPTGPDPVLVDQVTNAVMGQIMGMLQDAAKEQEAEKEKEIKLSGKKEKVNTKPKMEGTKDRMSFREAIHLSVTDGTPLAEGYESDVLEILEDEGIEGPLGFEPFFERGKLVVGKGEEKKAEKVLKQSRDIRKVPKIIGEELTPEEFLNMEAVSVDGRLKGFKEALKRLTYEKIKKLQKEEENKQKKYQAFVSVMLKKFGVESPDELEGEKKKAYFDALDKGWEAEGEEPEPEDKKKNENLEIKEATGGGLDFALGGLALGGGLWALKKAWDKWGKTSSLRKKFDKKGYDKAVIDKDKEDQDAADAAKAAGEIEKEKGTKDAQSKFDASRKAHGDDAQPPKGYSIDPDDESGKTVIPTADAQKKKNANLKTKLKKKQADRKANPKKPVIKPDKYGQAGTSKKSKQKADRKAAARKELEKRAQQNQSFIPIPSALYDLEEEDRKQLLEELVLEETMTQTESIELQAIMALDDAGIKAEINRKGQVVVKKKDKKKAHRAIEKSFPKGGWPAMRFEETSPYEVVSRARKRLIESADAEAERELYLYIENGMTMKKQKDSIIKNIIRKKKSGKYDHKQAPKLWAYLVDNGAKQYVKDFGGNVNSMFPRDVRQSVAIQFADEYNAAIDSGQYS